MVGPATGKARPPTVDVSRTAPADDWLEMIKCAITPGEVQAGFISS